jgi:hypothetical protein
VRGFLFNDVFMSMKYLITESKLNGAMIKFFEKEINLDEIQQHHPIEDNDDGEEYEDTNRTIFYIGDFLEDDGELFRYYECEYFYENSSARKNCPILKLDDRILNTFNGMFDDLWVEPFKQWINNELDLNVKSIE